MKFGLAFSLQSATGDWAAVYQQFLEQVKFVEESGFDMVVVSEHHFVPDGWVPSERVVCSAIAACTSRMRIGTAVTLLPLHHPVKVAEDTAVLDVISNGRFILGLGLGSRREEFEAFGVPLEERVPRFREGVKLVRKLLSEENVSHQGRFFKVSNISVTPRPVQKPSPPIWIGADSNPAVRRAAKLGDAWIANTLTPFTILKDYVKSYREELKRQGRDFDKLERPLRREAYVAKDSDTAWNEAKPGILRLFGEDYYRWGALIDEGGRRVTPERYTFQEYLMELRKRFIIGGPDEVIEKIENYRREFNPTLILLRINSPGLPHEKAMEAIRLLATKVMPHFEND